LMLAGLGRPVVRARPGDDLAAAASSFLICAAVAATSMGGLLVIDCTETGAPPPMDAPNHQAFRLPAAEGDPPAGYAARPSIAILFYRFTREAQTVPAVGHLP